MKQHKHIEIVRSNIISLSSMGQKSAEAICTVLAAQYTTVGVTIINTIGELDALVASAPDLVFLGLKYILDDDGHQVWVAGYLEDHGIRITGSGQASHRLESSKQLAKERMIEHGIATAPFFVALQGLLSGAQASRLLYPLFVKPTNKGGGVGIDEYSVVGNPEALHKKIAWINDTYQADSLVETYLSGREFSVAIIKDETSHELTIMPIELVADKDKNGSVLLSHVIKNSNSEDVLEVTDPIIRSSIVTLAGDAFRALGARDYGRIDIRMDEQGVPHFLEANLIPSLTDGYGSFPKACLINNGIGYEAIISSIAHFGLSRT